MDTASLQVRPSASHENVGNVGRSSLYNTMFNSKKPSSQRPQGNKGSLDHQVVCGVRIPVESFHVPETEVGHLPLLWQGNIKLASGRILNVRVVHVEGWDLDLMLAVENSLTPMATLGLYNVAGKEHSDCALDALVRSPNRIVSILLPGSEAEALSELKSCVNEKSIDLGTPELLGLIIPPKNKMHRELIAGCAQPLMVIWSTRGWQKEC